MPEDKGPASDWNRIKNMEIERSGNMSRVIYEALAKYKKNDKLPYTEYF